MVSDDQIMKTQTCFLQEMVQKERIQPSTVDLVHLVPFCLSLLQSCHNETDLNWLINQVKLVGDGIIFASLVEFKHNSMAETIQNKKEEKKTKAEAPGLTKKYKKHQTSNLNISVTAASVALIF